MGTRVGESVVLEDFARERQNVLVRLQREVREFSAPAVDKPSPIAAVQQHLVQHQVSSSQSPYEQLLSRISSLASLRHRQLELGARWRELIEQAGDFPDEKSGGGVLALQILETMSATKGHAKVRASPHHIVAALRICRNIREGEAILDWARRQRTGKVTPPLNAHVFSAMIKFYLVHKASHKARALHQVIKEEGVGLDLVLYNALLEAENDVANMWRLLEDMETAGIRPNDRTYAACLRCAGAVADTEAVGRLEDLLFGSGLRISLVTNNTLIDAWANCGEVAYGWHAAERLRRQGLRPDWWTFNTLIKMHALQGDKDGAFRAFEAMQAEGIRPDRVTYNTLLETCVQARKFDSALALYKRWRKQGDIEPDQITMAILLRAAGHRLDSKKVQKVLAEVKAAGIKMDEKMYESAVLAFVRCGEGAPALRMLEKMTSAGYPPAMEASQVLTKCVENALVRECKAAAPAGRLQQFLQDMAAAGVLPTAETGGSIVRTLALTKGPQAAMDVAWELQRGHVKPLGAATWEVLLEVIRGAEPPLYKQAAAAARLLPAALEEDGEEVDSTVFETCIAACTRAGDGVAALTLFEALQNRGLATELTIEKVWLDTVGAAIQGAITGGAPESAATDEDGPETSTQAAAAFGGTEVARQLAASGIRLTATSVPGLISAVAATSGSDVEETRGPREADGAGVTRAMLLVDVLPKLFDLPPSASAYNALMKACWDQKQFPRIEEVWQRMRLAQVAPDLATWRVRIKALARERLLAGRVSALLASMQKDGVAPDEDTLRTMLQACRFAGDQPGAQYMRSVIEAFERQEASRSSGTDSSEARRPRVPRELPTIKARRVVTRRSTLRNPEPAVDPLKERDRRRKRFTSKQSIAVPVRRDSEPPSELSSSETPATDTK